MQIYPYYVKLNDKEEVRCDSVEDALNYVANNSYMPTHRYYLAQRGLTLTGFYETKYANHEIRIERRVI